MTTLEAPTSPAEAVSETIYRPVSRCDAPADVAHHFTSAAQQFDAAKLGMWLFLATEVLLFGGLFVLYAVMRSNHPEVFHYGSQFLDARLGGLNTVILILSSLTMALSVYAAQRGAFKLLVTCLVLTVLGGAGFMSIKYVEYSHKIHEGLVLGPTFYSRPDWVKQEIALGEAPSEIGATATVVAPPAAPAPTASAPASAPATTATPAAARAPTAALTPAAKPLPAGDVAKGSAVWDSTCRTCHGATGEGLPGSGKPIRGSAFVASKTDAELLKFLKVGRSPSDPLNTTGSQMPPKGGNPLLKEADLINVIAFIRTMPGEAGPDAVPAAAGATPAPAEPATAAAQPVATTAIVEPPKAPEPLWIPKSSIPNAVESPSDLSKIYTEPRPAESLEEAIFPHHTVDTNRPDNAHQFFAIYYLMTGLHGVHVLIGMIVITGLLVLAIKGRFGPRNYTAIDLGGLYWHLVDLIWIFLFPLFYLL